MDYDIYQYLYNYIKVLFYFILNLSKLIFKTDEVDAWNLMLSWCEYNKCGPSIPLLASIRYGLIDAQTFRRGIALHPFLEGTGSSNHVMLYKVHNIDII